ncbi:flippase [Candidatus Wolfebacteria bacterium]|nr:flippase [Candidatus Wolfebacteria bacterium]
MNSKINKLKDFFFKNKTSRQTIAKNVFWLSMGQIAGRLIRALFIIYAARLLGATEYGVFSYALGLAGFFTIFADIGINQILTKEASQKPEKASIYFATSFWIKTVLLLGTIILVIFVAPHFSKIESAKIIIPFVAILVIFDNLRELSNAFFRAKEKMELEAFVNVLMNISIALIGIVILYYFSSAKAVTFSYIGSAGAGLFTAVFILREEFSKIISNFDRKLVRPILKSAWPIALSGLLGAFMLNVDIIMLGWIRSAQEIGFYSAGQKIIQLFYVLPTIIASAIFPILSRTVGKKQHQKATLIIEKGMTIILSLAIPLVIGGIILGKPIINFLYGNEYLPGALSFQVLLLTILIVFPQILLGNLVLVYNKQKKIAGYMFFASISNIVFNALLIPKFGIIGAAIATVIVQISYNILIWNMIKKVSHFKTLKNLKKIFLASIIMGIISFFLNKIGIHLIINITISAGFYLGLLFILKEKILEEGLILFKKSPENSN